MGMPPHFGALSDSSSCFIDGSRSPLQRDGNPNAFHFELLKKQIVGDAVVVELRYPDSFNYEGRKILLYKDHAEFEIAFDEGCLDPHFLEKGVTPFARFEPTEQGWMLALLCAWHIRMFGKNFKGK